MWQSSMERTDHDAITSNGIFNFKAAKKKIWSHLPPTPFASSDLQMTFTGILLKKANNGKAPI